MDLPNRGKLESEFARKTASMMGRHRRELASLLGHPPDVRNVPDSFWVKVQKETEEEISALLLLIFIASSQQHSPQGSGSIFQGFLDSAGKQWSEGRARFVSQSYVQNSRERLEELGTRWAENPETPKADISQDLVSLFGPDRAEGMAITEGTGAISAGGEAAIGQAGGISSGDLWITERDAKVCPICSPLHETDRNEWSLKFPSGPPAHPRCRCYIRYENEKNGKIPSQDNQLA